MRGLKCPSCEYHGATKIRFTPWGGVIGPRLMSLVKCTACGVHYNGKSGRRVEKAIRVYTATALVTLILLAAWMIYSFAGGVHEKAGNAAVRVGVAGGVFTAEHAESAELGKRV